MKYLFLALLSLLFVGCASDVTIGPILESHDDLFALHPIFSHEEYTDSGLKRTETDVLWPLATYSKREDSYYYRALLLYGTGHDNESRYRFRIFPFFFTGETKDGETYTAFFPFGGTIRDFLFFDRVSFVLFPIYANGTTKDVEMETYLWPFYLTRHGKNIDQFRLFPFYGHTQQRHKNQTDNSSFVLWPFWTESRTEGEHVNGGGSMLFPLYGHSKYERKKKGSIESWSILPPFFSYTHGDEGYTQLNAPWPFFRYLDDETHHNLEIWPIYGLRNGRTTHSRYFLWPLFSHTEIDGDEHKTYTHAPFPFFYAERCETGGKTNSYTRIWPLFSHQSTPNGSRTRFPELSFFHNHNRIERNWAPLWTLFLHEETPTGISKTDLLWGFISWGHGESGDGYFRFLWLLGPGTKPKVNLE